MPILQVVVGQIQLHNMGTEGGNLTVASCPADATAAQHKHAGKVQSVWCEKQQKAEIHNDE